MVKCKDCGYDNNDGSRVCLNCRASLSYFNVQISGSEQYIQANQAAIYAADEHIKKVRKTTLLIVLSLVAAFIIGIIIYFANLYKPVVDKNLLGSWESMGYYTDVWTFEADGTYDMIRSGGHSSDNLNIIDWYYKAEDGKLKTSWSKDVDKYVAVTYEYHFGLLENGEQCLILEKIESGGFKSTAAILYKVG